MTSLVDDLRSITGDGLRSVGEYRDREHVRLYRREDIELKYSPDEVEEIFDDLALQGLSRDHLEDLFRAGDLECAMFHFEEALMFHFPKGVGHGLFVTVDSDTPLVLSDFVETCKSYLED